MCQAGERGTCEWCWNRNLPYGLLREIVVEDIKISGLLQELNDYIMMLIKEGFQYEGIDGASKIKSGGCNVEAYQQ